MRCEMASGISALKRQATYRVEGVFSLLVQKVAQNNADTIGAQVRVSRYINSGCLPIDSSEGFNQERERGREREMVRNWCQAKR